MQVGLIGLGRMGSSMAQRWIAAEHDVCGYDAASDARRAFERHRGRAVPSSARLLAELAPRRVLWLMIPAGSAVDGVLDELEPGLAEGDVVVDGGNSNYRDTLRRAERLGERGVALLDAGTSGGIRGAENGFCLMVGGDPDAVEHVRPLLEALAPSPDRGWDRVGGPGAGHFAKMVHNGIEYGLMQAYAEGFALLDKRSESAERGDVQLDPARVAEVWRHGSVIRSWLLDLLAETLAEERALEGIEPWVDDSGEGRWTVAEAIDLDSPAPVLTLALLERLSSRERDSFAHRLLAALRGRFGGHPVRRKER